jgi:hypothetical protein
MNAYYGRHQAFPGGRCTPVILPVPAVRPTVAVCEPCGRRGTYNVARLMEQHGDGKLTDLFQTLANCPKARSASIHDRCKAVFDGLAV